MAHALAALPVFAWALALPAFALVQVLLLSLAAHRVLTLWRWARRAPAADVAPPARWPAVTVQLPLYNERAVAARLIDAVARLDYPARLLQVQVLDDSTDDTLAVARERVRHWRSRGVTIELLHRSARTGFKAGALAAALAHAMGEIVAVFDADFVPERDTLLRLVPHFADPRTGMVQARWGHLNRGRSLLTRAQAVLLDAHFRVEHEARMAAGLFFNFNGTAGAWRRACIDDAGGWSHDTLTEDLDLSYRAQLAGWRFRFAGDVEVPGELPSSVHAFKSQQRRWARGSIQTARKLLPAVLASRLPLRVKLEAVVHLTSNVAYPLLLVSGVLLGAVLARPAVLPPALALALDAFALALGVLPAAAFLAAGQAGSGRRRRERAADVLAALVVGAGLSVNNSLAVLAGLGRGVGNWERTPKTGEAARGSGSVAYSTRAGRGAMAAEALLGAGFAVVAAFAWHQGHARAMAFPLLLACGLGYLAALSLGRSHGRHSAT